MVKRYFPDLKIVGTGIAAVMSEDDGKFPAAWVQGSDYDALAAELARCRAANVYDGAAHKRVADLEAALRQLHHNARHALGGNAVRDRKIIEDAACERPSAPAYAKPVPDGHCPKCGERLIDGHHAPDLIPPFL